jgi:hypothetical protein
LLAALGVSSGCDQGSAKLSDGMKGPAPAVQWHYPEAKGATNGTIRVQFDRFLASDISKRQVFCVTPSSKPDECLATGSGSDAALSVEYDPVDRVVVLKPNKALGVGQYKVRVLAPKNASDAGGIRAFDGVPMAEEFSWEFAVDASAMAEEPNRKVDFCSAEQACAMPTDAKPVLDQFNVEALIEGCAGTSGCHVPSDKHLPQPAGEALILNAGEDAGGTPAQIRRIIAQHQVAPQTAIDPDPGQPRTLGGGAFGRNMPFIDPRNAGNSYVLYKMIIGMLICPGGGAADPLYCSGDGGTYGGAAVFASDFYGLDAGTCTDSFLHHAGDPQPYASWVPLDSWNPPAAGEYERLRYHIRGLQMPQGGAAPPYDIHMLSAWIANGAPVADCK